MTLHQNRVRSITLLFEVGFYNYFWQITSLCPMPIRGALPGSDRLLFWYISFIAWVYFNLLGYLCWWRSIQAIICLSETSCDQSVLHHKYSSNFLPWRSKSLSRYCLPHHIQCSDFKVVCHKEMGGITTSVKTINWVFINKYHKPSGLHT